jgi:SAM-dependent methyltransferase
MTESGSAPTAPDGSPVELYARMPTFGEPELIDGAIPVEVDILDLGAGAGRMTHRLVELGHPVTAIDNSAEMLARIRGAETVQGDIETLDLGRRFGCVLLASNLINVDDEQRRAFLATCARHVAPDGAVLVQRYDPAWAADPQPSETERDGVRIRVLAPRRTGRHLTATVEYELDGMTWRHGPFTATILEDDEVIAELRRAGLAFDRWLDERRSWIRARPVG